MTTENYYNENAESFIAQTFNVDVSDSIYAFTKSIPAGGKVLDVGCGSGRDTLTLKNLGFNVTAFDASEELARLASEKIQHPVLTMKIEDMKWNEEFDGVWAMASLLHLKRDEMSFNLNKIMEALKPEGTFFISLKAGSGEGLDEKGRFFTYYSQEEISNYFKELGHEEIEFLHNKDGLNREVTWISALIKKTPKLVLKKKL